MQAASFEDGGFFIAHTHSVLADCVGALYGALAFWSSLPTPHSLPPSRKLDGRFLSKPPEAIMATITLLRPEPLSFNAIDFDVVDIAGQPWLKSSDIARALGYSRADKVTRLFERNAEEFTANMTGMVEAPTLGHAQGLSTKHRVFSMRGAHLLAMFSRTEVAKAFRKWALDVIEAQAGVLGIPATLYKQALQAETREAKSFALASAGSRAMLLRKAEKAELVETVELMREAVQLRLALGYRVSVVASNEAMPQLA